MCTSAVINNKNYNLLATLLSKHYGSSFIRFNVAVSKRTTFHKIMQNNGHYGVQGN